MGRLQVLPENIANLIAAGEVVQRPASVVKELIENAVDAGADKITVVVTDSGRTLIQVIDNGSGMSAQDAALCFERHATSKVAKAEDLQSILTYGFRGEALASIAAVSDVTLRTRMKDDDLGTQVTVIGGKITEVKETAAPEGANFSVRNLFYNTPARRKFLKTDNVEARHIIEEFQRVALTRPEIGFSLTLNGKDVYSLKPAKSLKYRVLDLLGEGVTSEIVEVDVKTSILNMAGYVGRPQSARKTVGNQFFFVNGRFFRSPYLHKAVMKAYENYIPEGVTPSYFLYIQTDPQTVDVNIHPTKTEVKFEEEPVVFQIIYAGIKETLGKNSFGEAIDFEAAAVDNSIPVLGKNFEQYKSATQAAPAIDFNYNPFEDSSITPDPSFDLPPRPAPQTAPSSAIQQHQSYGRLFEDKVLPSTQILILHGKYIAVPVKSGMMLVHIRRAQERVLFDRFLRAVSKGEHVAQKSLFPVKVQVGKAQKLVFDQNEELLRNLGFDISPLGDDSIVFNGVPEGYSSDAASVQKTAADLLLVLSEGGISLQEMMHTATASRLSSLGARAMQDLTSPMEAQRLVDELLSSSNAEFTSSGSRIISIIPTEELDSRFSK
jgi:DNA mismatch repair protein MutL